MSIAACLDFLWRVTFTFLLLILATGTQQAASWCSKPTFVFLLAGVWQDRIKAPSCSLGFGKTESKRGIWTALLTQVLFRCQIFPKFHRAKRRFPITSKCRHMHEVLNIDEIKN
jgi:hypothetical protein